METIAERLKRQAEEQEEEAAQRALLDRSLEALLQTADGRAVVWEILAHGQAKVTSFSLEPLMMARREGERSYALWLEDWINSVDPEALIGMQREALRAYRDRQSARDTSAREGA